MASDYEGSIFLIEIDKIKPNPYQPRKEFNPDRLRDLADSIKQYGILQPLVVTRQEVEKPDGGIATEYEIIAGERRFRASQMAGLSLVPAIIRTGEQSDKLKLELAIIENLQREDLNPVDRAQAFFRLAQEFSLTHADIGKKIGKSREYVSNTIRILNLPQEILDAVVNGTISEGHTRPLLMLGDRPEEQMTFFKEIILKRMNVRESESLARRLAYDKVRKKDHFIEPDIIEMEERLTEKFGSRVTVEKKEVGGKLVIDFGSEEDLRRIMEMMTTSGPETILELKAAEKIENPPAVLAEEGEVSAPKEIVPPEQPDDELYFVKNFSL